MMSVLLPTACCSCKLVQQIPICCQLIYAIHVTYIPLRLTKWILTTVDAEASATETFQAYQLYQSTTIEGMRLLKTQTCLHDDFA